MRTRVAVITLLVAVISAALLPSLAIAQSAPATATTSSLIVKVVAGLTTDQQAAVVVRNGGTLTSSIAALRLLVVSVSSENLAASLARYQADPQVQSVEENKVRVSESVPSDALYASQWALPKIGWHQVFGAVTPTGSAKVALLDTGVDAAHPELADKVLSGTSFLDGSDGMTDPSGHGTWLAGIIAAQTNNGLEGIAGVAYSGVKILPVTVLNPNGEGQDSDVIAGVIWAADHGADVILMAFSASEFSPNLQDAIDYAWSKGAVLVAAVGNSASNTPTFPAGDRGVMGVAATDQNDAPAYFSNEGQSVFIAAPGIDIPATDIGSAFSTVTGTSASSAIVAGVAAFMKAVDPSLSNGVIVGRIARNADPAGTQVQTGNGRVNMERALADTSTEALQPAGADPVGAGGPFVGPYVAANVKLGLNGGLNIISPAGALDKTVDTSQSFVVQVTISNQNNAGDQSKTWSNLSATLTVPSGGWTKTADLSGANLGSQTAGGTSTCGAGVTTTSCTFVWTVTAPNIASNSHSITVAISGSPSGVTSCSGGNQCSDNGAINGIAVVNPASLSITSFTAQQGPSDVVVKSGDSISLSLTAANAAAPRATATGVAGSAVSVTSTGTASASCGAASAPGNIAAGGDRIYTYTCNTITGNGTLVFGASVSGTDENTGGTLSAGPANTNTITVDNTAPTSGLIPAGGSVVTPFSFSWNITDPTVNGVSSGVVPATCNVTVDGTTVSTLCSGSQSLSAGTRAVVVTATDVAGNMLSESRSYVVVSDDTPPVVTLTFQPASGLGGFYITPSVVGLITADDTTKGNSNISSITCSGATVGAITGLGTPTAFADVTVTGQGSHNVSCTAADSASNSGAASGSSNTTTVNIDSLAPDTIITANPSHPTNSTSATFTFTGTDAAPSSGGPTFECKLDSEATFTACTSPKTYTGLSDGSHTFQVRAKDTAGNVDATPASFTWVVDTVPPTVTVAFPAPTGSSGWFNASPVSGSVTATDGANVTAISCTDSAGGLAPGALSGGGTGSASRTLTVSGDATHGISCTATDGAGNTGAASGSNNTATLKIDTAPPSITFFSRLPAANTDAWNNTDVTVTWSCADAGSGPVSPQVTNIVNTEGLNQSAVGSCTDMAGNTASNTQIAISIDKSAPLNVTFIGGIADGASFYFGSVPVQPTCSAADALSGIRDCVVTGYGTSVGSHTLTATATDKADNATTANRSYTVLAWTILGFHSPVDMGGVLNIVKGGSTVPLKFEVFAGSNELTTTAAVSSILAKGVACTAGVPEDDLIVTDYPTGGTELRYDGTSGQFIFNWKTLKTPGKCYDVTVTTADGSSMTAKFKLK